MIYYAFEILLFLGLLSVAFFVYRALVNSPRFTRFIERTKGTETRLSDLEIQINVAEDNAEEGLSEAAKRIRKEFAAHRILKRRLGS